MRSMNASEIQNHSIALDHALDELAKVGFPDDAKERMTEEDFTKIIKFIVGEHHYREQLKKFIYDCFVGNIDDSNKSVIVTPNGEGFIVSMSFDIDDSIKRNFAITYDTVTKTFSLDIFLNQKMADTDADGKSVKDASVAHKGGYKKFTSLLSVNIEGDSVKVSAKEYGRLVFQDPRNGSELSSEEFNIVLQRRNEILVKTNALQNRLADLGICLRSSVLAAGEKGKLAQKVPHAIPLDKFECDDPDKLKEIYGKIIEKVAMLHAMGIVHTDIKPENILVLNGEPYLADLDMLGLNGELHGPKGTYDYMLPLAKLSVFWKEHVKDKNIPILPSQIRQAACYSKSGDLYALSRSMQQTIMSNDSSGESKELEVLSNDVGCFLNPGSESYKRLPDAVDANSQALSLSGLYKKITGKELVVNVDQSKETAVIVAFKEFAALSSNVSEVKLSWLSAILQGEQRSIMLDAIDDEYKKINSHAANDGLLNKLLADLLANMKNSDLTNVNYLMGDSVLSDQFLMDLTSRVSHAELANVMIYKQQLFVILQIVSLAILQAQLNNVDVNNKPLDVEKLLQVESVFARAFESATQREMYLQSKQLPKKITSPISEPSLMEIVQPTISLDVELASKSTPNGEFSDYNAVYKYFYQITLLGDKFDENLIYAFKKSNDAEQAEFIDAMEKHIKLLERVASYIGFLNFGRNPHWPDKKINHKVSALKHVYENMKGLKAKNLKKF